MDHSPVFMENKSMPSCSIIPVLLYDDVPKAIDWLCDAFGFTERWRAGNHRAQLSFGEGAIAVSSSGAAGQGQPREATRQTHSLMVRVLDVDRHYEHAVKTSAAILQLPSDFPYGERQYMVMDIGGHHWTFSQTIADVMPEEWGGTSGAGL